MKRLLCVLAFLAFASTVQAQTNASATWNQIEPPAIANTLTATLQVDTAQPLPLTLACVAASTGSTCTAPFPLATPVASHSYVLIVCNTNGCASMSTGGAPPGSSGFKIKVIVTVGGSDDDQDEDEEGGTR